MESVPATGDTMEVARTHDYETCPRLREDGHAPTNGSPVIRRSSNQLAESMSLSYCIYTSTATADPQYCFFMQGNNYLDLVPTFGSMAIQIPILHDLPAYPLLTIFQPTCFYHIIPGIPGVMLLLLSVFGNMDDSSLPRLR
ncbi:hypothetical protein EDB83DRAFT_2322286 [Lactarius deliciosus]|nr:hypothetical protein EDB83DRAFT_2322286 [Lactarius deliciosus]